MSSAPDVSTTDRRPRELPQPGRPRGDGLTSADWPKVVQAWLGRAFPPFPDSTLVPPVRLPEKPLLPAGSELFDRVQRVLVTAATLRGVTEVRTGRRSYFMRGTDLCNVEGHKDFDRTSRAAERMNELAIAPAAWFFWSFDQWAELYRLGHVPKKAGPTPPLSYLLSVKRFDDQLEWFEDSRDLYSCAQHQLCPAHRTLLAKWQVMWWRLLACRSKEEANRVVEEIFPGYAYETLVAAARQQSAAMTAENSRLASQGGVLWRK